MALLCVVLTAAVVIAGCVVYQEVEVVHDLFSPTTTVVLREAQTHGTWAPVPWEEGDRLRFEGLFAERAVTLMPTATARSHSGCGMTSTTLWWTS